MRLSLVILASCNEKKVLHVAYTECHVDSVHFFV